MSINIEQQIVIMKFQKLLIFKPAMIDKVGGKMDAIAEESRYLIGSDLSEKDLKDISEEDPS